MDPKDEDYEALEALFAQQRPQMDRALLEGHEVRESDMGPEGNVWEDTEPQPSPGGSALAAQGMIDELGPSIAPQLPDEPGNYVYDQQAQRYVNDDLDPYQAPDEMDLGRGTAFTDVVGNDFYSPYEGPHAGEVSPLPQIQGHELEQYMGDVESGAPSEYGGPTPGMPSFELPPTPDSPGAFSVDIGTPVIHKPQLDVEIGQPEIMPPEEEPASSYAPDDPALDPRGRRRL